MSFKLPAYLDLIEDPDERDAAKSRFLLRYAALLFSPGGRLNALSTALGLHEGSLAQLNSISLGLAIKIEELVGRDYLPREILNPLLATQE